MKNIIYIKYGILLILVCAGIWFYKDYLDKKEFQKDTENNQVQMLRLDSLRAATIILNDKQMKNYIDENKELKAILKENGIKQARVMSIMNHLLRYRDTTIVETDLSSVLNAINLKKDVLLPFKDSTKCLIIKGNINYKNGQLALNIIERTFLGNTTVIGYWERREWNFLGIKTRFLGKKQGTVKVTDKCGNSQIINIEKK